MLQISEIVRKTEEMFDLFNEHFYEGELNRPAITVSPVSYTHLDVYKRQRLHTVAGDDDRHAARIPEQAPQHPLAQPNRLTADDAAGFRPAGNADFQAVSYTHLVPVVRFTITV